MNPLFRLIRIIRNWRDIAKGRCEICGTTDPEARVRVYGPTIGNWRQLFGVYRPCRCLKCTCEWGMK